MIINYDNPGQLCNRIWSLLPSIAYGLEYKEKVLAINFDQYSGIFDDLNKNKLVNFASHKHLQRFFLSLKSRGKIQNGRPNFFSKYLKLNLVEGWSNRLGNAEMVINQSAGIRNIFSFDVEVVNKVDTLFLKFTDYVIIGVHIRRGDYKEWLNGIYYYSDDEYSCVMKNIEQRITAEGKKALFLLCSNEKVNLDNFKGLDCFVIPDSSSSHDLYALSRCSYIVGPPSSYSQWASFYGEVPVRFIMSANEKVELSEFSKVISFNNLEDGSVLDID